MMNKKCLASDGIKVEVMSWSTLFISVLYLFSAWIIYVIDLLLFQGFVLFFTAFLSVIIPFLFAEIAGCIEIIDEKV